MNEKELDWISKHKPIVYLKNRQGKEYRYGDTVDMMGITWTIDEIILDARIDQNSPTADHIPMYAITLTYLFDKSDRMYCINIEVDEKDVLELGFLQYVD